MYKLCFALLLLVDLHASAQYTFVKKWNRRYGGDRMEFFQNFKQTYDDGFILIGRSQSPISGDKSEPNWNATNADTDWWIVKLNFDGDKEWDKRYGSTKSDWPFDLVLDQDSGYYVGGYVSFKNGDVTTSINGAADMWLIKIDKEGNLKRQWSYGTSDGDGIQMLRRTSDGGFIMGQSTDAWADGDKSEPNRDPMGLTWDYWILKTDSTGKKQWDKTFGGTAMEIFRGLIQTRDGGFLLGGQSNSDSCSDKSENNRDQDRPDFWIIKTDSLGNKQWDKIYGDGGYDELYNLLESNDGGYVLEGLGNGTGIWIIKIDTLGKVQWHKNYGPGYYTTGSIGEDFGNFYQTADGGFLISGTTEWNAGFDKSEDNLGSPQSWLLKLDSLGNKQWDKTIFTLWSNWTRAVQTRNGCYAVANSSGGMGGYKNQDGWNGTADYWIMTFCMEEGTGINEVTNKVQLLTYPNPFTSELSITLQQQNPQQATITITNAIGQPLYTRTEDNLSNTYTKMLDLSYLPNGIYFVAVQVDGERIVKRVVKSAE